MKQAITICVLVAGLALGATNSVPPKAFSKVDTKATETVQTLQDGLKYRLQKCSDLTKTNWVNVGGYVIGNGNEYSFTDTKATNAAAFYRVIKY